MSFTSKTSLDGFNDGFNDGFGNTERGATVAQQEPPKTRELVLACGHPASPRHPFGGNPPAAKSPETSAADERASRAGISSRYSETRPRSLDPPGRFFDRIGVVAVVML